MKDRGQVNNQYQSLTQALIVTMFVTYTVETSVYTLSAGCKLVGEAMAAVTGYIVVPTAMVSVVRNVVLSVVGQSVSEVGHEVTVRTWVVRIVEVVESPPG